MGRLVQQSPAAGAHRQHPAGRGRGALLRHVGPTSYGGVTQTKQPPANPGRFIAPLELTRYSAPEAIVGAVSAASDWWSLGMIVLEQATAGRCFVDVNDRAFRLHVVTRGISLPDDLSPD